MTEPKKDNPRAAAKKIIEGEIAALREKIGNADKAIAAYEAEAGSTYELRRLRAKVANFATMIDGLEQAVARTISDVDKPEEGAKPQASETA